MKKPLLIVVGAVLGLVLVGMIGVTLFLRSLPDDIAPVDDSDLRRPTETLPSDQNAFTDYSAAGQALQYPDDRDRFNRILDGEEWDKTYIASVLASNAHCFADVKRGNVKERCLVPRVTSHDALMPHAAKWRSIARLFVLKAKFAARESKPDEALGAISDLLRFASLCEADAGSLIEHLVAVSMRDMALGAARSIVRSGVLDTVHLARLDGVLQSNSPSTHGLVLAWQTEYEVFANLVDSLAAGETLLDQDESSGSLSWLQQRGATYFLHPNRTKRDMAMFYTELIDQVSNAYAQTQLTDVDDFVMSKKRAVDTARGLGKFRVPNPIGTILYAMLIPSSQGVMKRKCNSQVSHRATVILAALHTFRKRNGHFPLTLEGLVPEILAEIPLDPYDGRQMRYSHAKGIVYSVGEDLRDSGGSTELLPHKNPRTPRQRQWQAEDLVFEVQETIEQPDGAVTQESARSAAP